MDDGIIAHKRIELAKLMTARLNRDGILSPEELAARLKVRKTWVYEQTRSRNQNPLPCLREGALSPIRSDEGRRVTDCERRFEMACFRGSFGRISCRRLSSKPLAT